MSPPSREGGAIIAGVRHELKRRVQQWYREPAIGGVPHLQQSLTVAMFDLLALCHTHGLLVDRGKIKYIRSLRLVDGLVSRLSPALDLAHKSAESVKSFSHEKHRIRYYLGRPFLTSWRMSCWLWLVRRRGSSVSRESNGSGVGRSNGQIGSRNRIRASAVGAFGWLWQSLQLRVGRRFRLALIPFQGIVLLDSGELGRYG